MYFLNQFDDSGSDTLEFITANEQTGFMHLYHRKLLLEKNEAAYISEWALRAKVLLNERLTEGEWMIELENNVYVDSENNLVYFTAFRDPLENHL